MTEITVILLPHKTSIVKYRLEGRNFEIESVWQLSVTHDVTSKPKKTYVVT